MIPVPSTVADDVARALAEDAAAADATAALVPDRPAAAEIRCRQDAVLCGSPWAEAAFRQLDPGVAADWRAADGDAVAAGARVCSLRGPARALLSGERAALNFLQLLSGVATRVRAHVRALGGADCLLLDTRKTLPGLRAAQKYAVACGGAAPHRASLAAAVLIKENHWALLDDLAAAVRRARARAPDLPVIVEVEDLAQLAAARAARPDVILLDNLAPEQAREAARRCPDIPLEASGGLTPENLADYAAAGAARLSVGGLTKDVRAVDFSMRLRPA